MSTTEKPSTSTSALSTVTALIEPARNETSVALTTITHVVEAPIDHILKNKTTVGVLETTAPTVELIFNTSGPIKTFVEDFNKSADNGDVYELRYETTATTFVELFVDNSTDAVLQNFSSFVKIEKSRYALNPLPLNIP